MAVSWSLAAFAFSAGSAAFFAPCSFPLLPGYLSFYVGSSAAVETDGGTGRVAARLDSFVPRSSPAWSLLRSVTRALFVGVVVTLGMLAVYGTIAGVAVAVGARALRNIAVFELITGGVFVVAGVAMAAGWKLSRSIVRLPERRRTAAGFLAFGALYAAAAAGCTAPIFIAVVLRGMAVGPAAGVEIGLAYAAGMGAVMIGVTVGTAVVGTAFLSALSKHTGTIYRIAGVLLALSGLAEIYYYFYGFPPIVRNAIGGIPV